MNSPTEDAAPDLAANHARYMAVHVWREEIPNNETIRCDGCQRCYVQPELHLIGNGYFLCAVCNEISQGEEPACECRQTDVDLFDARGCELHDAASAWNVRRREITAVELYNQEVA